MANGERVFSEWMVLTEAEVLAEDTVGVRIIEPGLSKNRNIYPANVLAAAHKLYEGARVFLDHPTKQEDVQRPERSVRDLCGYLEEVQPNMQAKLKVVAHSDVVMPLIREAVASGKPIIGLSQNALGTGKVVRHSDGKPARLVEAIVAVKSVDIVTQAAAGGSFQRLMESEGGIDLDTLQELLEAYPELMTEFKGQVLAEAKPATPGDDVLKGWQAQLDSMQEALKERDNQIAELAGLVEAQRRAQVIGEALASSKLNEVGQGRVRSLIEAGTYDDDEALGNALKEAIDGERAYVASILEQAGNGRVQGMGATKAEATEPAALKEARAYLERAMGVEESAEGGDK